MNVQSVFNVFSRRSPQADAPLKPLTKQFRTRVPMLCRNRFDTSDAGAGDNFREMLLEVRAYLCFLLGRNVLHADPRITSDADDVFTFLNRCEDKHFLDFIEYMFQTETYSRIWSVDGDPMVDEINHLFALDDLPYALTHFVREQRIEDWRGRPTTTIVTIAHPRVILRQQQVPHAEAIEPALHLLADLGFSSANKEFLDALTEYRKGDYEDCLAKCGSAFESTMKLICEKRGWAYKQTDTAAPLLKTVMEKSGLPSYYEQPLLIVATLRNKESSSHGGGVQPKKAEPHVARYAINATATAILLLVEQCK